MSLTNQRLRLYGKSATKEEIAAEVAKLLLGNPERKILPKSISEVARILNFDSRTTIYQYRDLALEMGLLQIDSQSGKPQLPQKPKESQFVSFNENHPITQEPLVSEWLQNMKNRKGGAPIDSWRSYLRSVEIVCNTLRIPPERFLDSLKQSEKYLENFLDIYKTGQAEMQYTANVDFVDMKNIAYTFSKGIRDFMNYYGLRYPKGFGGVMSQKVPNHAKYADIRFTDEEIIEADRWTQENYGIDSDEYRLLFTGIESCSRKEALFKMTCSYTKHTSSKTGKTTYIMTAYESKTRHIKGGKWTKYITKPELQKSIDLHIKKNGGARLYKSGITEKKATDKFQEFLIKLYVHLNKIPNLEELQAMRKRKIANTGNYWFDHLIHALRHVGAHYWLKKKRYNYGLVAKIGGWNTIDELKNSYGEMPPEVVLELLEDEEKIEI